MTICYKLLKTSVDKYIASLLKMSLWVLNKTVLNVVTEITCDIANQTNLPSIHWVLAQNWLHMYDLFVIKV